MRGDLPATNVRDGLIELSVPNFPATPVDLNDAARVNRWRAIRRRYLENAAKLICPAGAAIRILKR